MMGIVGRVGDLSRDEDCDPLLQVARQFRQSHKPLDMDGDRASQFGVVLPTADDRFFCFERMIGSRAHPLSLFTQNLLSGVFATFGEPKSKWKSGRYSLTKLQFDKELFSESAALAFWKRFHVNT